MGKRRRLALRGGKECFRLYPAYRVDYLIRELCVWATENPISAGALAIVIVYLVFRSLGVRRGRGHAPT